jgi:hypothetical protein
MIGRPLIIIPYDRPGCIARVSGFLTTWAVRLLLVGLGFLLGYGCDVLK